MTSRTARDRRPFLFFPLALILCCAAFAQDKPAPTPIPSAAQGHPDKAAHPAPTGGATSALVVNVSGAQTLMGLPVQTAKNEDLGRVVDVVADRSGALLAAIIDFGGFLGVGTRKIAIDWRILHFPKSGDLSKLVADLPLDQLRIAPVYKPGEPIVIMGAPAPPSPVSRTVSATPTETKP